MVTFYLIYILPAKRTTLFLLFVPFQPPLLILRTPQIHPYLRGIVCESRNATRESETGCSSEQLNITIARAALVYFRCYSTLTCVNSKRRVSRCFMVLLSWIGYGKF